MIKNNQFSIKLSFTISVSHDNILLSICYECWIKGRISFYPLSSSSFYSENMVAYCIRWVSILQIYINKLRLTKCQEGCSLNCVGSENTHTLMIGLDKYIEIMKYFSLFLNDPQLLYDYDKILNYFNYCTSVGLLFHWSGGVFLLLLLRLWKVRGEHNK